MKKRHNIDTIAEILIDKINELDKNAKRIENTVEALRKSSLKVDTDEMKQILSERSTQENAFLSHYKTLQEKNNTRLPNWILTLLIGFFLAFLGFSFYAWSQIKQVELLKAKIEYYEQE